MSAKSSPGGARGWARRLVVAVAVAYPVSLVLVALLLRFVGEGWWATGVALYLPRLGFALPLPFLVAALLGFRLWRLLILQGPAVLVIVFPLMGFVLPGPTGADRDAPTMRVLSYNVNHAYGGVDRIAEEIARYNPDVVLVQELVANIDGLTAVLKTRYPSVQWSSQFVIATRFPIVNRVSPTKIPHEGRERSPRFEQYVLDTPLGQIAVYNVHPISPRTGLYQLRDGGFRRGLLSGELLSGAKAGAFREDAALRTLQIKAFTERADRETVPVVIAGDLNLPGLSPLLSRELGRFQDGFRAAGFGLGYTFPVNHVPWMRIDRILASAGLRFVKFEVGQSTASDHRCVVADLQRRAK